MSYKSMKEILNAVFDSSDGTLKTTYKTEGEVFNLIYDESANALRVNIDGFTGGTGGIIDGEAATFADLPDATEHAGDIYIVHTTTGLMLINRRQAGMYRSDGTSWSLLDVNLSADKVYYTGTLASENVLDALEELNTTKAEMIYSSITLNVANSGGDFTSLNDALAYLNNYRLAPNVTVTIQIADGTYTMPSTISLRHPDFANIYIIGNTSDQTQVILDCGNSAGGIYIQNGQRIGYLGGFTILNSSGYGLLISDSSELINGGIIEILEPLLYGVYCINKSRILCSGFVIRGANSRGLYIRNNSDIYTNSILQIENCASDGVRVDTNSRLSSSGVIKLTGNTSTGAYSTLGSKIILSGSTIDIRGNTLNDLYAYYDGIIYAKNAQYNYASPAVNIAGNANSYIYV
jgi:hypothetical protein